jgi:lysophospholipase L1-like esterase
MQLRPGGSFAEDLARLKDSPDFARSRKIPRDVSLPQMTQARATPATEHMKKLRRLLVCSLTLNLTFFVLGGVFVYKKGGMRYLVTRAGLLPEADASYPQPMGSPVYRGRRDTYAVLPGADADVVFAGDSITDFCEWSELLERPALNRGINGDTVEGLRLRIDEVLQHHPRQLFIMIGINDLLQGRSTEEVLAQYRLIVERIRTSSPRTQIFLQSILPVSSATWIAFAGSDFRPDLVPKTVQVNRALAAMADGGQVVYVDLYSAMSAETNQLDSRYTSDGLHLSGAGYAKWRDVVRPHLAPRHE